MSQNSLVMHAMPIVINVNLNTSYVAPTCLSSSYSPLPTQPYKWSQHSPPTFGFGSWLDSLNDISGEGLGYTSLATTSPKSIWNAGDIPSPSFEKWADSRRERLTPVVKSDCEMVYPRPIISSTVNKRCVWNMEKQAAAMAKQRERELRAAAIARRSQFERSDDDEIVAIPKRRRTRNSGGYDWAAAMAVLAKSSNYIHSKEQA